MWGKKTPLILLPAIAVGVVAASYYIHSQSRHDPNLVRVSGNIEVTDAEVSFKIAGRVQTHLVTEGEMVRVGQLVARLDRVDVAQEVALRKAEVQATQAAPTELEAG
jgi:HlyD family secretion protein